MGGLSRKLTPRNSTYDPIVKAFYFCYNEQLTQFSLLWCLTCAYIISYNLRYLREEQMKNSTLPLWGTDEKFHVTFVGEQMPVSNWGRHRYVHWKTGLPSWLRTPLSNRLTNPKRQESQDSQTSFGQIPAKPILILASKNKNWNWFLEPDPNLFLRTGSRIELLVLNMYLTMY
jgi:hypothetical protein